MEFKKSPKPATAPKTRLPMRAVQGPKAIAVSSQVAIQRDLQRHTARPTRLQRQVAQPVLQAAQLHTQEVQRLAVQRQAVQGEAGRFTLSAPQVEAALQRQQATPPVIPAQPRGVGDWVTVMRARAEEIQGQRLSPREAAQYTALQRQVAQTIASGFRADRQSITARHQEYAGYLATLQRSPGAAPVAAVALGLLSAGERPAVQRALDETLQREVQQQAQDTQALHLHSLQRQLAELDHEATQPVFERIQARRGAGNPLPAAIQRHLEQGLNHDLSAVRIHDDAEADKLAKGVNATAFTTGTDIYFQSGKFSPNTQTGLELLAHEATHTVQQARGEIGPGLDPSVGHESQAREMGRRLASRPMASVAQNKVSSGRLPTTTRLPVLQRAPDPEAKGTGKQAATTKIHPDVALKMLDSYNRSGSFNFKPELGKGGASWFVTRGNPHVGIDPSKIIDIKVDIDIAKDAVVLREADLLKLLAEAEAEHKDAIEAEWVKRTGHLPTTSREKNTFKNFKRKFVETKMCDKVAAQIKASKKGVGRVILENSSFSRSGDGEFAVVTDPSKLKVKTSIGELISSLKGSGHAAEGPVQEATAKMLKTEGITGTVRGIFRYGGRLLIVIGLAADAYKIYHAQDKKLAVVESVGGWAGATAAGSAFAAWFAPADVAGWPAWTVHGVGTLVAGGVGYWAGSKATRTIYQIVLER